MTTPVEELPFEEVIERTKKLERDLLLGNGFSIAAHRGFDYRRLLERASVPDEIRDIFAFARTTNFESVMRILLAETVGAGARGARDTREKIEALKRALVVSIHEVHPARRSLIPAPRWERCECFLERFIGKKQAGRIFTTNYDLLLSWAVAPDRDRIKPEKRLRAYEGFRGGTYDALGAATIIYLHGALHLYAVGLRERQLQYWGTGVPLHDQIADRLNNGHFPIIVTEGASSLKKPVSSGFLRDAQIAFRGTTRGGDKKALFTAGHGLGVEDRHLFDLIPKGTIQTICLGGFRRAEMDAFHELGGRWVAARRTASGPPLKVYIFDTENEIWGPDPTLA